MYAKIIGAGLIVLGSAGVGAVMVRSYWNQLNMLRKLIRAVEYMECELNYRMLPLPDLARSAGEITGGTVGRVLSEFADELDRQAVADAAHCMRAVLASNRELPKVVYAGFEELGRCLGTFNLQGQLECLNSVRLSCRRSLEDLEADKAVRLRSYQTLGLCAGAALAILLV